MAVIPAARMLLELGVPPATSAASRQSAGTTPKCNSCISEEEVRLGTEASFARGFADGMVQASNDQIVKSREIEALAHARYETRLCALSKELLGKLDAGHERLRDEIARTTAKLLGAFLADKIRQESLEAMAVELRRILAEKVVERVLLSGPQELIDTLKPMIAGSPCAIDVAPTDQSEVRITVDQVVLETAIGDWISGIESAL